MFYYVIPSDIKKSSTMSPTNNIDQDGIIDVAASIPITISGNLMITIAALILLALIVIYMWRRNRFGRQEDHLRLTTIRRHQQKIRDRVAFNNELKQLTYEPPILPNPSAPSNPTDPNFKF